MADTGQDKGRAREREWPSRFALWVCRWFGHDLFAGHCTRCGYDKPFVVGKLRKSYVCPECGNPNAFDQHDQHCPATRQSADSPVSAAGLRDLREQK